MIKMIILDVDGTLIPEGKSELEDGLIDVIKKLQLQGYRFAIASGRAYKSLLNLFGEIKDSLLFLGESGNCIFDGKGNLLMSNPLLEEDSKYIFDLVTTHPTAEILLGTGLTSYVYTKSEEFLHIMRDIKKTPIVEVSSYDEIKHQVVKISSYCPEDYEAFKTVMKQKGRDTYHTDASAENWVDYSKGNKADGIRFMCEMIGIIPAECAYYGDSHNDLDALNIVGFPTVMNCAAPELLELFEHHADSVKTELEKLLNT